MIDPKVLRTIKRQTANNDHGGALLTAAGALGVGCTVIGGRIASINWRHEQLGYLSPGLEFDRREAYVDLMAFAKRVMTPADYQKLYDAF